VNRGEVLKISSTSQKSERKVRAGKGWHVGIPTTVKAAKTKWYRQGTLCKRAKVLESSVQLYM
jgi:hypothetical protein